MLKPIISADHHVNERPECYVERIDARFKACAPRMDHAYKRHRRWMRDRMMWANDFQRSDSSWPCSQELLSNPRVHMSADERNLIVRDNVTTLYSLDTSRPRAAGA